VQLLVERLHLAPEARRLLGEVVGRHVVSGAPHGAEVLVAQLASAFVRERDVAHVVLADRARRLVPALPGVEQLVVVATGGNHGLKFRLVAAAVGTLLAVLRRAVLRLHPGEHRSELGALRGVVRGRGRQAELQQVDRALRGRRHRLALVGLRLRDHLAERPEQALVGLGIDELGVDRDVGRLRPAGGVDLERQFGQLLVQPRDEVVGRRGGGDAGRQRGHDGGGGADEQGATEGVTGHGNLDVCSGERDRRAHAAVHGWVRRA
jgi:hypothetical protein